MLILSEKWLILSPLEHYNSFKFLRGNVDEKHLQRFQSETYFFKFLQRSVSKVQSAVLLVPNRFQEMTFAL